MRARATSPWSDTRSPGSRARSLRTCWGLRPRRSVQALALARLSMLPSAQCTASASRGWCFRGSMASLFAPLSTLHRHPRGYRRMTRGQCGSLHLHWRRLALLTPCRSPGAHIDTLRHRTSGVSVGGAATPSLRRTLSVGQVGGKSETTRCIASLNFEIGAVAGAAPDELELPASPSDAGQRQRLEGSVETRQCVTEAVGWPKSAASACRRQRGTAMPIAPVLSAAS
jgi:hypothetical protein